ncbi:MAG TPA: hypothetical protein VKV73_05810 [Chloroflexota bacterium]|nr:hypothetical protein [Chloroflexota bacterium]
MSQSTTTGDFDPASPGFQLDPHAAWARLRVEVPRGPGAVPTATAGR